jgi:16S rRNA (uracil1498-N3)-methyltransferase
LHDAVQFKDLIETFARGTLASTSKLKLICMMGAAPITSVVRSFKPHSIVVACGPEGDFTTSEIELAKGAGFVPASLGNNRLRSETAAIAAVSIAAALLDELRTGG